MCLWAIGSNIDLWRDLGERIVEIVFSLAQVEITACYCY